MGMLDLGAGAAYARETLIIPGTSTALTSSTYGASANKARITHEGANIRYWTAKTDAQVVLTPTETNGHLHRESDPAIELNSASEVTNFRALRVETSGVSILQVEYFH